MQVTELKNSNYCSIGKLLANLSRNCHIGLVIGLKITVQLGVTIICYLDIRYKCSQDPQSHITTFISKNSHGWTCESHWQCCLTNARIHTMPTVHWEHIFKIPIKSKPIRENGWNFAWPLRMNSSYDPQNFRKFDGPMQL